MKLIARSLRTSAAILLLASAATIAQTAAKTATILVETDFVAFEKGDITALSDKQGYASTQDLLKLRAAGKGTLRYAPQIVTVSGQQATVKAVSEYNYPAGMTLTAPTNAALSPLGIVLYSNPIQTREAGTTLTVLPTLAADGKTINMSFQAETLNDVDWKDSGSAGARPESGPRTEQPVFHTHSISTSIVLRDGETRVLGGGISSTKDKSLVYVFVTATILKD